MSLETMDPNPVWTEEAYAETVDVLAALRDEVTYKVWGGDWCIDCRSQLPDFGAALEAAGVPDSRIEEYAVKKEDDGTKVGPKVDEYDIEYIPTVVVERDAPSASNGASGDEPRARDGEEVARFVEEEPVPIAVYLGRELEHLTGTA